MDLTLFVVFLSLSLILIALGLIMTEHTELSLVGFVFLFLLSMIVIQNDIQYQTGVNISTSYSYKNISGELLLNSSNELRTDVYNDSTLGGSLSHTIGYWLAVASIIGFAGVILGIRKDRQVV